MPRFFFDVHDGRNIIDEEGSDLPDIEAAKTAAVRYASALISELGDPFWDGSDWKMTVSDAKHLTLFELHFFGVDSPVLHRAR